MYILVCDSYTNAIYVHRSSPVDVNCLALMRGFSTDFIVTETVEFARMDNVDTFASILQSLYSYIASNDPILQQ